MRRRMHVAVVAVAALLSVLGAAHPAGATFPGVNGRLAVSTPEYKSVTQGGCLARGQLHLIAPDGSGHEQITDDRGLRFAGPQWSPDSTRLSADVEILDRCLNRVYVIDVAARSYHEVPCGFECFGGAWTADGSRLLVTPSGILGTTINSIYSIAPDGSGLRLLVAAAPGTRLGDATASADGRHIAYTREGSATVGGANSSVMIAAADGTNPQRVGTGAGAEFSPDSTRLLYTSTDPADGGQAPVVSDLAGGGRIRVAPAPGLRANALSWSPDGTQILLGVASPLEQKNIVLAVRAPDGTQAHLPGATSPGCLLGYRIVMQGDLDGATWGSSGPVAGQGAAPANVPCPAVAPPAPLPPAASSQLRASISNRRGELRVRVTVNAAARGRIIVDATQHGRSLSRRGLAGRTPTRVYRYAIRRSGTVDVSVRFVGRTGWASKQLRTRKVRRVLPPRE